MSVAGAMAGSCVSLMKHWEGCCLFQGSGGSLACQDAPAGWRGGCQRAPRPRALPRLSPSALPGVRRPVSGHPSAQHVCLLPFHPSPVCVVLCPQTCPPPKVPAPSEGRPPALLLRQRTWSSPHTECLLPQSRDGCPFPFTARLGYGLGC